MARPCSFVLPAVGRSATLALACVWLTACAPAATIPAAADLPPYEGDHARLFDDSLSLQLANPHLAADGERLLTVRAAEADLIALGRLTTINERRQGARSVFHLVFAFEQSLVGEAPSEPLTLEVGPQNPSHGMIRTQRLRLIGVRAILFMKWFQQDNESRLHARGEPDAPSVHDAIAARM